MIRWLFFIFLNFQFAFSQVVNIENRRIYDDTAGISGSIFGSFSALQNQNLLLSGAFRPLVQYKTKMHYYLFIGDWNFSKSAQAVYSNSGMAHFRYAYRLAFLSKKPKSPWKLEVYSQIQYNQLLRQKMRALAGSGLRWKIIEKRDRYRAFWGGSTLYEYEVLLDDSVIKNFRFSTYLSWHIGLPVKFTFSGTNYYQPRIDNFADTRFMGQYSLSYRLNRSISLRADANVFYQSRPVENVRSIVYNTTLGLNIGLN